LHGSAEWRRISWYDVCTARVTVSEWRAGSEWRIGSECKPFPLLGRETHVRVLGFSGFNNSVRFKRTRFPDLADREYRVAQGFDAAVALVGDDGVEFAAAEERFSRTKGTGAFPVGAMRACLEHARLQPDSIDVVAHAFAYDCARSSYQHDELGRAQYDEVYAPGLQVECLREHFAGVDWANRFVAVPHHLAHAASAFYPSGLPEALIIVSDGMGEMHSATILTGSGSAMDVVASIPAFHSIGVLYSVFTLYLGFQFNMDEYKVMGLAPYGNQHRYFTQVMELVRLQGDGTYSIPIFGEDRTVEEQQTHRGVLRALAERFGPPRAPEEAIEQRFMDIAAALQAVLQTCQLHVLTCFKQKTGARDLCMAGGVALNCTANGVIRRSRLFRNVFVQPAAGDDGAALGAALLVQRQREPATPRAMVGAPLWGPGFDEGAIGHAVAQRSECEVHHFESFDALVDESAQRLAQGQIIGWFQGRMEFGPRALGNRSILADPRAPDMRDRVNMLVKKRENFRPFAPAVTAEAASEYFEIDAGDEETYSHMLFTMPVRVAYREKLPAITHVDGSARVQTVPRASNQRFWSLLNTFGRMTGIPMLLNTSFNVRGQPIVCTPEEAIDTFLFAKLDALVLGDYLLLRHTPESAP
jgi:carbamoyltransferase